MFVEKPHHNDKYIKQASEEQPIVMPALQIGCTIKAGKTKSACTGAFCLSTKPLTWLRWSGK
jgi:hypothetical protein